MSKKTNTYITTKHVDIFKIIVKALSKILSDATITFTPLSKTKIKDEKTESVVNMQYEKKKFTGKNNLVNNGGIRILSMSNTNSLLVLVDMYGGKFDEFVCKNEVSIRIGLASLHKSISGIEKKSVLSLSYDAKQKNELGITIKTGTKVETDSITLKELIKEELKLDSISFSSRMRISSEEFKKTCKKLSSRAKSVEIKYKNGVLYFTSSSEEGKFAIKYTCDDQDDESDEESDEESDDEDDVVCGNFPLDTLMLCTNCSSMSDVVELYLRNDFPLMVRYVSSVLATVTFCISPMVLKED